MDDWDAAVDWDDADLGESAAVLYSGGCDSTLAACRMAERFSTVHLVTFTRFGFLETDNPSLHIERMRQRYPDTTFHFHKIPYGRFYEAVEGHQKLRNLWRFGSMTSVPCGSCKVAMHWRAVVFCLENDVKVVADGAIKGNDHFAEQNPRILMPELQKMYDEFGLTVLHPVYDVGLETEVELYRLGIHDTPSVKRTKADKQVVCSQHILFGMWMRKYLDGHSFEEYEEQSHAYLSGKVDYVRELLQEHAADLDGRTRVSRLKE
jgi:predicted subunit of tRNA(5-methylaminomethyl-2-thiouridylate) methyltransferase